MKPILEMINKIKKGKTMSYHKTNPTFEQKNEDGEEAILFLEEPSNDPMKNEVALKMSSLVLIVLLSMILLSLLIIGVINNINKFIPFLI